MAVSFLQQAVAAGASGASEINMVEDQIDAVVKQIEGELDQLWPYALAFGGSVSDLSWGGGESAPNLRLHYSKAHEVTWKTLMGVKQDLLDFQEACRLAKQEIVDADQSAGAQLASVTSAVEVLNTGNGGRNTRHAHDSARNQVGQADS